MCAFCGSRPDLLAPEAIEALRELQDNLPAFPLKQVRALIERDIEGDVELHFAHIDEHPVAAASVAQVHRAQLPNGEVAAIKMLRPNIRARVQRDRSVLLAR